MSPFVIDCLKVAGCIAGYLLFIVVLCRAIGYSAPQDGRGQ